MQEMTMGAADVVVVPAQGWMMTGLGGAIRKRRLALGLTQVELAARVGADQSTISAIEGGRRHWPTREVREAIARELGWSNLQLLVAAGEVDPNDVSADLTRDQDFSALYAVWRGLSPDDRASVMVLAQGLANRNRAR